jgi:hypothetical protein
MRRCEVCQYDRGVFFDKTKSIWLCKSPGTCAKRFALRTMADAAWEARARESRFVSCMPSLARSPLDADLTRAWRGPERPFHVKLGT